MHAFPCSVPARQFALPDATVKVLHVPSQGLPCFRVRPAGRVKGEGERGIRTDLMRRPQQYVPEVLFSTIEPPPGIQTLGDGLLIEARVGRSKKKLQGEHNATAVGDLIPFLEHELHLQLMFNLKLNGTCAPT